jgi:hypothetical protein
MVTVRPMSKEDLNDINCLEMFFFSMGINAHDAREKSRPWRRHGTIKVEDDGWIVDLVLES